MHRKLARGLAWINIRVCVYMEQVVNIVGGIIGAVNVNMEVNVGGNFGSNIGGKYGELVDMEVYVGGKSIVDVALTC